MGWTDLQKEALSASFVSRAGSDPLQTVAAWEESEFPPEPKVSSASINPPTRLGYKENLLRGFLVWG